MRNFHSVAVAVPTPQALPDPAVPQKSTDTQEERSAQFQGLWICMTRVLTDLQGHGTGWDLHYQGLHRYAQA